MAQKLGVKSGTRLQIALDVPLGQEPVFDKVCTFKKELDESSFLVSIPMSGGKSMQVSEIQKLLIRMGTEADAAIVAGYVDAVVTEGIHRFWKIRRVTELRQFYKRADERYKVTLRVTYFQDTWPLNSDGVIVPEDGLTVDISYGGMAFFMSRRLEVGEICHVTMPIFGPAQEGGMVDDIIGVACWQREAPKGSPFRLICGLQFRFANSATKEAYVRYVENLKKKLAI